MTWKITKRKLNELHPHPKQAELSSDLPESELDALADDMARDGLRQPILILSDGTIISGHQRTNAAKKLGWTSIDVIVRDDLLDQDPDAVERLLIEDNFHRRHDDPLAKARSIKRLHELHYSNPDPRLWKSSGDLRDKIGKGLGISGREVSRYLKLLDAPIEVQRAVQNKKLSLEKAGKIANMAADVQAAIAARIADGEDPNSVLKDYLTHVPKRALNPTDSYRTFRKRIQKALEDIPEPIGEISEYAASESAIEEFEQTSVICRKLARFAKAAVARQPPPDPELVRLIQSQAVPAPKVQTADAPESQTTPKQKSKRQPTARRSAKAKPKAK